MLEWGYWQSMPHSGRSLPKAAALQNQADLSSSRHVLLPKGLQTILQCSLLIAVANVWLSDASIWETQKGMLLATGLHALLGVYHHSFASSASDIWLVASTSNMLGFH